MVISLPELLDLSDQRNIPELHIRNCPKLNLHGLGNHERVTVVGRDRMTSEIDDLSDVSEEGEIESTE